MYQKSKQLTHDGHGVDGGVVLLDEELDEGGEALHGGVVEGRPARLRLAVDEGVLAQQDLANVLTSDLRRQMHGSLALMVKHVYSARPVCVRSII